MVQRLEGLSDVDPQTTQLPVGTEVVTRVERNIDGKMRAQGAVGTVLSQAVNGHFTIGFIDGKQGIFTRPELLPRKIGLLRYAQRRDSTWHSLANTVVLDALVGSTAWGLADETSDQDHRGVFVLPLPWLTGLVDPPTDLLSEDRTIAHWEVGKAVRQGLPLASAAMQMFLAASGLGHGAADDSQVIRAYRALNGKGRKK